MAIKPVSEIAEIISGGTPKTSNQEYWGGNIPWLSVKDFNNGSKYVSNTEKTITRKGLEHSTTNLLQKNDIILSARGTVGAMAKISKPMAFNQSCFGIRAKSGLDQDFLYYALKNKITELTAFTQGSVFSTINRSSFDQWLLDIPSVRKQKSISHILSVLDAKIEINTQINDYLSEIASALFSHEILESIDDTWLRASLLDIASYKNGLAMQKYRPEKDDPGLPVLKIKELAQGQCAADAERCRSGIDESVKVFDGDLIFSWSGTLLLDFWAGGNAGLNQHLFKVTSKKYKQWFYYFWTNYHMRKFITLAKDRATTMGHIKRSALAESEVYIPNENKMNELDKLFDPLIKKIISLKIESRILSELRNELLPKLMSGEIDVCKVGVLVERL